jgi:hypothetical protein
VRGWQRLEGRVCGGGRPAAGGGSMQRASGSIGRGPSQPRLVGAGGGADLRQKEEAGSVRAWSRPRPRPGAGGGTGLMRKDQVGGVGAGHSEEAKRGR